VLKYTKYSYKTRVLTPSSHFALKSIALDMVLYKGGSCGLVGSYTPVNAVLPP
jgi:hypothetical protein